MVLTDIVKFVTMTRSFVLIRENLASFPQKTIEINNNKNAGRELIKKNPNINIHQTIRWNPFSP